MINQKIKTEYGEVNVIFPFRDRIINYNLNGISVSYNMDDEADHNWDCAQNIAHEMGLTPEQMDDMFSRDEDEDLIAIGLQYFLQVYRYGIRRPANELLDLEDRTYILFQYKKNKDIIEGSYESSIKTVISFETEVTKLKHFLVADIDWWIKKSDFYNNLKKF